MNRSLSLVALASLAAMAGTAAASSDGSTNTTAGAAGTTPISLSGIAPGMRMAAPTPGARRAVPGAPTPAGMKVIQTATGSFYVSSSWGTYPTDPAQRSHAGSTPVGANMTQFKIPTIAVERKAPPPVETALDGVLSARSSSYLALAPQVRSELVQAISSAAMRAVATLENRALRPQDTRFVETVFEQVLLTSMADAAGELDRVLPGRTLTRTQIEALESTLETRFKEVARRSMVACSAAATCTRATDDARMTQDMTVGLRAVFGGLMSLPPVIGSTASGNTGDRGGFAGYRFVRWDGYNEAIAGDMFGAATMLQGDGTRVLPASGKARYAGPVSGMVQGNAPMPGQAADHVFRQSVTGRVNLDVDFASRSLTGTMTELRTADGRPLVNPQDVRSTSASGAEALRTAAHVVNLSGRATAGLMQGTLSGSDRARTPIGGWQGAFFGPQAQEFGATWSLNLGNRTAGGIMVANNGSPTGMPAPAPAPAPAITQAPAPAATVQAAAPAAPVAVPVPRAPSAPPAAPARPRTGSFDTWAGTPPPSVVMTPRALAVQGLNRGDPMHAVYAGDTSATVINNRDNGRASTVTGEVRLGVNLRERVVNGEIGNFNGRDASANFLNSGTIRVQGAVDRAGRISGSSVWTPGAAVSTATSVASGNFTGSVALIPVFSTGAPPTSMPGQQASGSWGVGNADFTVQGSWRGTRQPAGTRP